jgi:pimeloyl-ACP methyl ester carboxylesterase
MPRATTPHGIELEYETMGDPDDPALLLVMGLGAQMVAWDDEFCQSLVDRGFYVIRFDNRDVGLSTKIEWDSDAMVAIMTAFSGGTVEPPYLLADMADDAIAVLDAVGVDRAHIVGASMGGMIVQSMAIAHPDRVQSMTSIMSTTGDPDVGTPNADILPQLLAPIPPDREGAIARAVEVSRIIGSPEHFEEDRARLKAERSYDRCFHPVGTMQQLVAIAASPSRSEALRTIDINTLVIHGDADPLVNVTGGERTAEVIIGAELLILEGMGHDLPSTFWASVISAITALASRSTVDA